MSVQKVMVDIFSWSSPLHSMFNITGVLSKYLTAWREGASSRDLLRNLFLWHLTLYGPNSFFRRFSGHNLR